MNSEEHRVRHEELHQCLDELVADWISHTHCSPSKASVLELMQWSAAQMISTSEHDDH